MITPHEIARLERTLVEDRALSAMLDTEGGKILVEQLKLRMDELTSTLLSEDTRKANTFTTVAGAANEIKLLIWMLTDETPRRMQETVKKLKELEAKGASHGR